MNKLGSRFGYKIASDLIKAITRDTEKSNLNTIKTIGSVVGGLGGSIEESKSARTIGGNTASMKVNIPKAYADAFVEEVNSIVGSKFKSWSDMRIDK